MSADFGLESDLRILSQEIPEFSLCFVLFEFRSARFKVYDIL